MRKAKCRIVSVDGDYCWVAVGDILVQVSRDKKDPKRAALRIAAMFRCTPLCMEC